MTDQEQMQCPECSDDAVLQAPSNLVPWQANGIVPPQWSHQDGTSLCPVIGEQGYEPAQPQPRSLDRATEPVELEADLTNRDREAGA